MKKLILLFGLLMTLSMTAQDTPNAQTARDVPDAQLVDMKGNKVSFKDIIKSDKPVIVSFWATWCANCINELDAINEVYADWQEETGVKLIAISEDDDRTARRILSSVNGRNWDYEIYRDFNFELKRALNMPDIPYLIIIKNGKIVAEHINYSPGIEDEIYEMIKN